MTATPIPAGRGPAVFWTDLWQRAPDIARHSERVTWLACRIAAAAGVSRADLDTLCWAARLHDYGKLALPPALSEHSGPLSPVAWVLMRRHPILAADVIHAAGRPAVATIVAQHHERPDGTGYPAGLAGSAVSYLARILALADSWETICLGRPYQPGRSYATALLVLVAGAGTQWDADLVALVRATWPIHPPAPLICGLPHIQGAA